MASKRNWRGRPSWLVAWGWHRDSFEEVVPSALGIHTFDPARSGNAKKPDPSGAFRTLADQPLGSEEIDASRLSSTGQRAVLHLGQVGYFTKGVALGLVGGLLAYAAWTFDWEKASNLDAALAIILVQPLGRWLLSAMALGFIAFGAFATLQFRYRRM